MIRTASVVLLLAVAGALAWPEPRHSQLIAASRQSAPDIDLSSYPGFVLNLDASIPSSLQSDGTYITNWVDQSGYGNHAWQTNTTVFSGSTGIGSAPTLTTNILTGKVGIQFGIGYSGPSSQGELILPALQSGSSQSNWTVFAVVKVTGDQPSNRGTIIGAHSAAFASGHQLSLFGQTTNLAHRILYRAVDTSLQNAKGTAGDITTDTVVVATRLDIGNNSIAVYAGGAATTSAATSSPLWDAGSSAAWRIGMSAETLNTCFEGIIHHVVYYTNALSDTAVSEINNYLEGKWK